MKQIKATTRRPKPRTIVPKYLIPQVRKILLQGLEQVVKTADRQGLFMYISTEFVDAMMDRLYVRRAGDKNGIFTLFSAVREEFIDFWDTTVYDKSGKAIRRNGRSLLRKRPVKVVIDRKYKDV
jgi:hypothetical protein